MKKGFIICIVIILILTMCFMSACNAQIVDVTNYNRAIIKLPNGEIIEGKVDSWKNFEYGDQVQVKIEGKTYLTFSANVVLISD